MRFTSPVGPRRGPVGLALAMLLAGVFLVVAPAPAMACTCVRASVQDSADRADVVISGTVLKSRRQSTEAGRPNRDLVTLTVDVDRVYKGTITHDTVDVTTPANPASCGLGVVPEDERYFVFAQAQGSDLSTNLCAGTRRASSAYTTRVRAALGEGATLDGSARTSAPPNLMVVDDSAPPDFLRTAAPGAALAIVGLLGLLLVRRRARRD